uniref:Uncharacterized protein n=1 Tax=Strigamia maritima TaxID=126957 RepID=T1IPR7_STRMM
MDMNSPRPSTSKCADYEADYDYFDENNTLAAIPLKYEPLFPNATENLGGNIRSIFPAASSNENVKSSNRETRSLFPAACSDDRIKNSNADVTYNWLNFSSITTDGLLEGLKDIKCEIEKEVSKDNISTAQRTVSREASKSHKKKRWRSSSPNLKRRRLPAPDLKRKQLENDLISQNSKKVFIEDVGLLPGHAFRVDRKAEQTNLAFSCFNPVQSARYLKEVKFRPPIGLTPSAENEWLKGLRGKKKRADRNAHRYCSRQNFAILQNEEGILDMSKDRLKISKEKFQTQSASSEDFIPTTSSTIREKRKKENVDGRDSEEDDLKETTSKYISRKTSDYNQYLRENPKDEDKWMEFIKFQDNAIEVTFQDEKNRKISERAIFERKISVLDKAIETNPTSIKLVVAKMKICEHYWESAELKKEWQKILFTHPNNILVWDNYLLFLQSHFSTFSFSTVVKGYAKCFSKLNSLLEGTFISHSPPPDLAGHMLRILLKFCQFLHQVGHREKALACFQAMMEFNFFTPVSLNFNMNLNDWLAFFEPFWDSSVPRFGEENAPGWATFMANKMSPDENTEVNADNELEEDKIVQLKLSRDETWCRLEKIREERHWLPWKPNTVQSEDDCEDPDRMVLVDDVSPFLFRLRTVELKFRLVKTFFIFLGVEFEPHFLTACQALECHPPSVVECPASLLSYRKCFEYKFEKKSLFPNLLNEESVLNDSFTNFVNQTIEKCICLFDEPHRTEIQVQWLQMKRIYLQNMKRSIVKDYKKMFKETRKFFKSLLKEESNRNKLGLWLEFVQLELENDHSDEAKKMIDMIIASQPKNVLDSNNSLLCTFYKLYAEIELNQNSNTCLNILISLATGEKINTANQNKSTVTLKVKSLFQRSVNVVNENYKNEVEDCQRVWLNGSSFSKSFLIEWVPCCAMFYYLNSGLQAAVLLYEGFIDKLTNLLDTLENVNRMFVKLDLEQLYFSYISLLLHHVNTTTGSLKIMRTVIDRALVLYPQNIHFLQLLTDVESRSHISGRLRRHFNKSMILNCHPVVCFYAVAAELSRLHTLEKSDIAFKGNFDFGSGILCKVRSYFERSLECEECQHCPLLWRMYLKFEIENGNEKQSKAVFYRALQHCVWNKKIYLDATRIPDCLQEILDIMTEKEIRARIPIEEVDLLFKAASQQHTELLI